MEKRGVVTNSELVKTGSTGANCPTCGAELLEEAYCGTNCGTKPFEKKPTEDTSKKK